MTEQHPITPPPELVQGWNDQASYYGNTLAVIQAIATQAAQWGADQELELCANWLADPCAADMPSLAKDLRYSRRPKPPSLAERALAQTNAILNDSSRVLLTEVRETLELNRRALERLQELENND